MREPAFWREKNPRTRAAAPVTRLLLTPIAAIYAWAGARRIKKTLAFDCERPVVCIGNLTVGGVGKTPLTRFLRERIQKHFGVRVATLSRGYGGSHSGPLKVEEASHSAREVGDEPLMMAYSGESWIGRDRVAAAQAMSSAGVDVIIMDDGFQNPSLKKDLSIIVLDAIDPFGNGFVFPKGPLREPVAEGLKRADLIVLMGDGETPSEIKDAPIPIIRARTIPRAAPAPGRYVAFAGIGNPLKFFDTLGTYKDVELSETVPYADHHPYSQSDIEFLRTLASERSARLITTEKDYVRMAPDQREGVLAFPVLAEIPEPDDLEVLDAALASALKVKSS